MTNTQAVKLSIHKIVSKKFREHYTTNKKGTSIDLVFSRTSYKNFISTLLNYRLSNSKLNAVKCINEYSETAFTERLGLRASKEIGDEIFYIKLN